MTGAGLKKCRPMTRDGRVVAAAIAATDSALVLVARMAVGGAARSSARKIARLAARSSIAASMTRSATVGEVVQRARDMQPGRPALDPVVDRVGVEVQSRGAARQTVADPALDAGDRGRVEVVDADVVAGLEGDLGDAGAHRAGADDPDRPDLRAHGQIGLIASNGWRQSRQ